MLTILAEADPSTLAGLFAWLVTEAGMGALTSAVIGLVIWVLKGRGHDLGDREKVVISAAVPFLAVLIGYAGLIGLGIEGASLERLYEHVYSAVMMVVAAQGVFHLIYKPVLRQPIRELLAKRQSSG
jgi:hypothetical protein